MSETVQSWHNIYTAQQILLLAEDMLVTKAEPH